MKAIKLNQSEVIFNQEEHTYTLKGKELQGITNMLSIHLFPHKYDNIDDEVLQRAAERGSFIHEQIELSDGGFEPSEQSDELCSYKAIKARNKLTTLANEYLVSDNQNFASCIDLVLQEKDGAISLADIKTTYKLDKEYIRWQLSIYAMLFELQNPHLEVSHLYGIWLRGEKSDFCEVERIPSDIINELFKVHLTGGLFVNPYALAKTDAASAPMEIRSAEIALAEMETQLKELKEKKEKLMDGLLILMQNHGVKSYKGSFVQLIRKNQSVRKDLDKQRLEKEHPEIYNQYLKETTVKESLTLKLV